jgi:hypothetical protein
VVVGVWGLVGVVDLVGGVGWCGWEAGEWALVGEAVGGWVVGRRDVLGR